MNPYKHIVILTGAGISAESGISTFRDNGGLWENHELEEVASLHGFRRNPDLVYRFYNERRKQLLSSDIRPNRAHLALKELEETVSASVTIITQNVDDLHERAGSQNILHMHGELLKARCLKTESVFKTTGDIDATSICDCCKESGNLRPHIVWFGEIPFYMKEINDLLEEADLFLSIGTSGQVYPAAMFVQSAKLGSDCKTVEINLEKTPVSWNFDEKIYGKATDTVPDLALKLISRCVPKNSRF